MGRSALAGKGGKDVAKCARTGAVYADSQVVAKCITTRSKGSILFVHRAEIAACGDKMDCMR